MALSLLFLSFILPFVFGTPPIWPTSAILSCPCTFSIARPLNATAPSNILFIRLSDWQALPRSSSYSSIAAIAHISHPLSIHRATSHPTHLRLQPITVREHGQFAAVVSQGVHVEPFRLLNVKRVNGTCPVIIQEHPPSQPPTTLPPTTPPSTNQSTPVSSRIVGGHLAAKALGPYLVFLITGQTGCTGTLIGSRWILTAAHCGTNSSTIVYFGENAHNLFSEAYGVQKVYNHIQYAKGYPFEQWDIAVLKLAQPAPSAARFLKVNINPTIPIPGSAVRAIGFGFTMSYNQSLPPDGGEDGKLRQVDLPVVTHSDCERLYRVSLVEKIQVCAGYRNGGCDSW